MTAGIYGKAVQSMLGNIGGIQAIHKLKEGLGA